MKTSFFDFCLTVGIEITIPNLLAHLQDIPNHVLENHCRWSLSEMPDMTENVIVRPAKIKWGLNEMHIT